MNSPIRHPRSRPADGDDTATAVVVANLLADVLYAWLDPRITY
jgi:hypothetical protein